MLTESQQVFKVLFVTQVLSMARTSIVLLFVRGSGRFTKQGLEVCAVRPTCAGKSVPPHLGGEDWSTALPQLGASGTHQNAAHFPIPGPGPTHGSACFPAFLDHFAHGSFQKTIQ